MEIIVKIYKKIKINKYIIHKIIKNINEKKNIFIKK